MHLSKAKGKLRLTQEEQVLLPTIQVAETFWQRGLGLMGRQAVPSIWGAGLFFPHCRCLHGCFMRFELEVWFLDAEGQPLGQVCRLKPWGLVRGPKETVHCLEILPGSLHPALKGDWVWAAV